MTRSPLLAEPPPAPSAVTLTGLTVVWLALLSVIIDIDGLLQPSRSLPKLDLRLGYDVSDVRALFAAYGDHGRHLYAQLTWVDQAFAIVVAVWGDGLARAMNPSRPWLQQTTRVAPWAFAGLDVLENVVVLSLLDSYPALPAPLVTLASSVTALKLCALLITYGTAVSVAWRGTHAALWGVVPRLHTARSSQGAQRLLGLVMLGVAVALTIIQTRVFNGPEAPTWVQPLVSATIADAEGAYQRFGRLFLAVPLVLLVLLPSWSEARRVGDRWLARVLWLALVADFASYWVFGVAYPNLRALSFWGVEVPCWVLITLGATYQGIRSLRSTAKARQRSLALLLPGVLICVSLFQYLPHALTLPFLLAAAMAPRVQHRATSERTARGVSLVG